METKRLIEATCPDCRGPLSDHVQDDEIHEYRCVVGHCYSARTLLQAHSEAQEKALWAAVVSLEETAALVDALVFEFDAELQARLRAQVEQKLLQAGRLREVLEKLEPFETQ